MDQQIELMTEKAVAALEEIKAKDIMQVSYNGELVVDTDYEVRKNFIGNVDMVVSFKKHFDQRLIKAGGK